MVSPVGRSDAFSAPRCPMLSCPQESHLPMRRLCRAHLRAVRPTSAWRNWRAPAWRGEVTRLPLVTRKHRRQWNRTSTTTKRQVRLRAQAGSRPTRLATNDAGEGRSASWVPTLRARAEASSLRDQRTKAVVRRAGEETGRRKSGAALVPPVVLPAGLVAIVSPRPLA